MRVPLNSYRILQCNLLSSLFGIWNPLVPLTLNGRYFTHTPGCIVYTTQEHALRAESADVVAVLLLYGTSRLLTSSAIIGVYMYTCVLHDNGCTQHLARVYTM